MAIRLTGTFKSPATSPVGPDYSAEYTVNIYDNDYSGDPVDVLIRSCKVLWDSEKGDDRHSPIIGSRATINLNIPATNTDLTTFIEDFAYGEDARFLIEIIKSSSPTDVWRGIATADQSGEEDIDPFDFKISAICGLGLLKKKPYHDGSALYTGINRFTEHITTALKKMPHIAMFWGVGDVFIRTAVDWWSASMASGADDDAMFQGGVDHAAFYDYQKEGGIDEDVLSSYDVLSNILRAFGLRIYQSEGHFRIDQIPYRSASPYYTRDYDLDGAFISSAANSNANVINQTSAGAKLTLVNYDFLPILKKAEVTYDVRLRRNFLNGFNLQSGGLSTIDFDQAISANGGDAIMRLRGNVSFGVKNLTYSGNPTDVLFFVPNIKLQIGTNYLKRDYTIVNFTAQLKPPEWTAVSGDRIYLPHSLGPIGTTGSQINGSFNIDILTPALPSDGDDNVLIFATGSLVKWNGSGVSDSEFQIYWSASNLFLEIYDEGTPIVSEDEVLYTATNPLDAVEIYETKIRIGSETLSNSAGRVFRWNGSIWVTAPLWGQGVATRDDLLGDLLAINILNGQSSARRRMNGSLYGNFRIHRLMQTTDGREWMFSRVDWDLTQNTMNGSWIELDYGTDGVSSTPIKKKIIPNGPTYPPFPDPADPNGLTNNAPGFVSNPPPTVLAPIAYNALDSEIFEGDTITTIPIKTISAGNEFLAGDLVTITNPYTGAFQDFTISTPPTAGATSLSVSSAAAISDYPEDSYLTIKQKAYAYSLPTGASGDHLYFNGTDWVAENFAEDVDDRVASLLVAGTNITLTYNDGANTLTIAATGGGGTVTSVALSMPSIFSVSGSPVTTSGTLTATLATQLANLIFAGPSSGGAAAPTFRSLALADFSANLLTFAKIQQIATDKLLGRDTAGTGDVEQIGLGASLSFDGAGNIQRAALTGDVTAAANGNATTIANSAVTNAKMANMAASTIKGNNTGGAAAPIDLTVAQVQTLLGFIDGAGSANRLAFWTDANTLSNDAAYTVDAANDRMTITGTVAGTGANSAFLNLNSGAISGATEFLRMSGNITGNMIASLLNANNLANSNTLFTISVGGSVAGDPILQFTIGGVVTHAVGADNSDSDKFKITTNSSTPGGNGNASFVMTKDAVPLYGFNTDSPARTVDVSGDVRAKNLVNTDAPPTWSLLDTGLGTGGTVNSTTGGNNGFQVNFTTGTSPAADGVLFRLTLANPFSVTQTPVLFCKNVAAMNESQKFLISGNSPGFITLKANGTLTASTNYIVNIITVGQ